MTDLTARWREEATTLERNGFVDSARVLTRCADEVDTYKPNEEAIPLVAAAELCGYTYQHLWRCVREGKLVNYGDARHIRVRPSELPRKPGYGR